LRTCTEPCNHALDIHVGCVSRQWSLQLAGWEVTHTEGGKKGDRWQLVWPYRGTDVQALKHEVW